MKFKLGNYLNVPIYMETKMTREEAINKVKTLPFGRDAIHPTLLVRALEVLGLIKFDDEVCDKLFEQTVALNGTIRLERWKEGLVLWVGGEIVYKSWKS
jgi:hypothetical protein